MASHDITADKLKQLLNYDPATGVFTWRIKRGPMKAGSIAGKLNTWGYRVISINRRHMMASRLAWLYMAGELPKHQIDHINRNKDDNSWLNLRDVTPSANQHNTSIRKDNKSGYKGVWFYANDGVWRAAIKVNGKQRTLGQYATAELANQAYLDGVKRYHTPVPQR